MNDLFESPAPKKLEAEKGKHLSPGQYRTLMNYIDREYTQAGRPLLGDTAMAELLSGVVEIGFPVKAANMRKAREELGLHTVVPKAKSQGQAQAPGISLAPSDLQVLLAGQHEIESLFNALADKIDAQRATMMRLA
jgi:hypothetical protein